MYYIGMGEEKKKRENSNDRTYMHVHTRWFQMTPKADITTPIMFPIAHKKNTFSPAFYHGL